MRAKEQKMSRTKNHILPLRLAMLCAGPVFFLSGTGMGFASAVGAGGNTGSSVSLPASVSPATLGALANAQSEAALLKEKLEIAKLKAEIKKVEEGKSLGSNQTAYPQAMPVTMMPNGSMPNGDSGDHRLPKVVSILGGSNGDVADLALPGGGTVAVRVGASVAPWGKVAAISGSGVYLDHKGKRLLLPFVASDGASVAPSGNTFAGPSSGGGGNSFLPPNVTQGIPQNLPPVGAPPMPKE
ncbi:MAG: type IV pilus biogenesis protein PilP [Novosphingobium sp.]